MRISDWSSDVCASDLQCLLQLRPVEIGLTRLANLQPLDQALQDQRARGRDVRGQSVSARLRAAGQPVDDGRAQGGVEMVARGGDLRVAGGFGGPLQQQRRTYAAAFTGSVVAVVAAHFRGQAALAIEAEKIGKE